MRSPTHLLPAAPGSLPGTCSLPGSRLDQLGEFSEQGQRPASRKNNPETKKGTGVVNRQSPEIPSLVRFPHYLTRSIKLEGTEP